MLKSFHENDFSPMLPLSICCNCMMNHVQLYCKYGVSNLIYFKFQIICETGVSATKKTQSMCRIFFCFLFLTYVHIWFLAFHIFLQPLYLTNYVLAISMHIIYITCICTYNTCICTYIVGLEFRKSIDKFSNHLMLQNLKKRTFLNVLFLCYS